jgi:hypothetical protein
MQNYVVYGLIAVGCLFILANFIKPTYIIAKLFKKTKVENAPVSVGEENFLHIISLWYQLKECCDKCKLSVASDKLDEVFPLLNLNEVQVNDKVS